MNETVVISNLLNIIDFYNKQEHSMDMILDTQINDDAVYITRLSTKGEANKGTPFYFGHLKTSVITEVWYEGEVVNAWIVAESK